MVVALAGVASLAGCVADAGPTWLCGAGAVTIATAYSWALAARVGGRPMIVGLLAVLLGTGVILSDDDALRTGAAVLTCAVAAVLAVVATVPAKRYVGAVREVVIALAIASVGALATVGFEPVAKVARFEYVTLGLSLVGALAVVYQLAAGQHGLRRRGAVTVLIGTGFLALTLAYAELLRGYGTTSLVNNLLDAVTWSRDKLGAFPRPIAAIVGVPALAWGTRIRAQRRQGWWLCAFGVAATASAANTLVNPSITLREGGLSVLYGAVIGLVIGFLLIRLDRSLSGSGARRGRRIEEAAALHPEPSRTQPLL